VDAYHSNPEALNFLRHQGFNYLKSVSGGISAWSDGIDRNVPRH
jgi:rhodanese-related sulfurtransferase